MAGLSDLGMQPGQWGSGGARMMSGKNGAMLGTFIGLEAAAVSGHTVVLGPEMNGDGKRDIFLGGQNYQQHDGIIEIFSPVTKQRFTTIVNDARGTQMGTSVSILGDLNQDGYAEYVVGSAFELVQEVLNVGAARVYSGKTGLLLTSVGEVRAGSQSGMAVCGGGDMNEDGLCEFVDGAPYYNGVGSDTGIVRVHAGKAVGNNFSNLYILGGLLDGEHYGAAVDSVGDMNNGGGAERRPATIQPP